MSCLNCGGLTQRHANFCSWACGVEAARKDGAVEHLPNGLPIKCVTGTGLLLECEHGDHADYMFPVEVEGPATETYVSGEGEEVEMPSCYPEQHALIYTDGSVALTLSECSYAIWLVETGEGLGGNCQRECERLSEDSCAKIRAAAAEGSESDG